MSMVVVERSFPGPAAFEDVQAVEDRNAWCLEARGVRLLRTYFSRDRRRMICLYEAPDAESARVAQERAGLPFDRVWAVQALRYAGPEPGGEAVVVERVLAQPLDEAAIRGAVARGSWCLEHWGCRIVWTYLSTDGRRCLCVFAAPDTESVRAAQKTASLPYEAAWPATVHEPRTP